jgi:DNA-binding HxlR family transcriptional regulator
VLGGDRLRFGDIRATVEGISGKVLTARERYDAGR